MSKRYTFTKPYEDAYEIVDRDIDKAMKPEDAADLLNKQDQQISDLEAKLAESEEAIKYLKGIKRYDIGELLTENTKLKQQLKENEKKNFELIAKLNLKEHRPAFCTLADRECEALGKVEELKQQLAEKEKEIEKLQHCNDRLAQGIYHSYGEHFILKIKQDKISFALEQLENVKETTECVLDNALKNCSLNQSYYDRLLDEIDNQIKQLKEMK